MPENADYPSWRERRARKRAARAYVDGLRGRHEKYRRCPDDAAPGWWCRMFHDHEHFRYGIDDGTRP